MIELDDAHPPIWLVRFSDVVNLDDAQRFCQFVDATRSHQTTIDRPYAFIFDGLGVTRVDASARHRFSEFAADRVSAPLCVGSVAIIANPLLRGVLTALRWVSPAARETHTSSTLRGATEILRGAFRARALPPPVVLNELDELAPAMAPPA